MTESEFSTVGCAVLDRIEEAIEAADIDADLERKSEGLLEIELANQSRVVVNMQAPMQQIWVAAKSGGFHFAAAPAGWRDTRSGEDLFDLLSRVVSEQSGIPVRLA